MRSAAPVLVALFAACGSPPPPAPPPVENPPAASTSVATEPLVAPPVSAANTASAAPPVASAAPPDVEPVITKGRIVVPEGACSGRSLSFAAIVKACACEIGSGPGVKGTPCPRESKGQAEEIHDLAVTLTAAAPTVKAGAKARVTVRFENKSEKALPLSFLRDHPLELIFRGEDGRALPTEGKNNCVSSVGLAKLAGVTLGPGGAVSSEIAVAATKRKHRAGPDACGTVDGSPLTPGKYQIAIDESPLWGIGLTKNATVEVVAK